MTQLQTTYKKSDLAFLRAQNQKKPVNPPPKLISSYVNGLGRAPDGTPFPGAYNINRTPYVIEPLDNMSPFSGVKNTAVMKSVQSGFTFNLGEGTIKYYIGARPAKIMYMSGTDDLLKKFLNGRFDPMIDSCGFRPLIRSQSLKKNNRKTGDLAQYKEFPGGTLTLGSLQSEASMRQESIMIMIRDEISLVDAQMSSGEGNRLKVSDGRTVAYDESGRVKILDYSTPKVHGSCLIEIQYHKGDQRKFFVKCPVCGKRQYLAMGDEKSSYGLKGDYTAGKLTNAYFVCYHCGDAFFNYQKEQLLQSGVWQPTAEPVSPDFRSYHFPAFYSPMLSWLTIRREYDEAIDEGDEGLRSFTNLYLAEPFVSSGERPPYRTVIEIRSSDKSYKSGIVPADMLFLTASTDVQPGKQKYAKYSNEDITGLVGKIQAKDKESSQLREIPRLEMEVCAHGHKYRTASVIYKTFWGRIDDIESGAWKLMTDWIKDTEMIFARKDGFELQVKQIFVDSGQGEYTDLVYQYCDPLPMTHAIKGDKARKEDKLHMYEIDEKQPGGNIRRFKLSKSGDYSIVLINSNYYKNFIYRNLSKGYEGHADQPGNTHITPCDYPDYYFKQLRAEEKKQDGSFHNRASARNEALDLLVYNKAAADFYIDGLIQADEEAIKRIAKNRRQQIPTKEKLHELVNRKTVLARLEGELRKRGW